MDTNTIPVDITALRFALLYAIIATPGIITMLSLAPKGLRLWYSLGWAVFSALMAAVL